MPKPIRGRCGRVNQAQPKPHPPHLHVATRSGFCLKPAGRAPCGMQQELAPKGYRPAYSCCADGCPVVGEQRTTPLRTQLLKDEVLRLLEVAGVDVVRPWSRSALRGATGTYRFCDDHFPPAARAVGELVARSNPSTGGMQVGMVVAIEPGTVEQETRTRGDRERVAALPVTERFSEHVAQYRIA